jgi:hypothetical protein
MPQIENTSDLPEAIYHYCPEKSFYGILESKTLWLSDVRYMHDATEQKHFLDLAKQRLNELNHGDLYWDVQPIINNLERYSHYVFVFCFSKKVDLFKQWSEYADESKGYSIGFSSQWFRKNIHRARSEFCTFLKNDDINTRGRAVV